MSESKQKNVLNKPKITVITSVYNSVKTIEETILSVANQNYSYIEHIIIDGSSTDGTIEVIKKHANKIAIIKSESDKGMYDAMNKGLAIATGDIIGFLNADDIYANPLVLDEIARVLNISDVDCVYGDLVYCAKHNLEKVIRYWKSQPYQKGLFEKGWMPAHPTFYAKRWVYDKYGGYDISYKRQSDFELTMRFLTVYNIKSAYIPKVLVRMRSGGASQGIWHILEGNIEAYRACKKHSLKVTPFFVIKKILSRVPQFINRYNHKTFPK